MLFVILYANMQSFKQFLQPWHLLDKTLCVKNAFKINNTKNL